MKVGVASMILGLSIFAMVVRIRPQVNSSAAGAAGRVPVLVELFTSEGCSSCPPADELLRKLDKVQPVPGAEVIVLGEHIDYFDHIGWKDPFSSPAYTERQERYVERMKLNGAYTPQMVVDGEFQFNGSDAETAIQAIEKAATAEKLFVKLAPAQTNKNGKIFINVRTAPLPGPSNTSSADVIIAVADDVDVSNVGSGENSGKTLTNVAVAREIKTVGRIDKTDGFSKDVETNIPVTRTNKSRIIVIVQEPHQGKLLGIASTQYPL
jgi:hypothetical protein